MNCDQIQDLLPLYAGSDLEEDRARLVAAHVQSCETCAGTAREYRETRQLLQIFTPPTFTEDFYAEMRQGVWQNLEKKSPGPTLSSIIADLFRPRLAWAIAAAVLIVVSVVGIYVSSRRGAVPQPVVSNQPSPSHTTQDVQPMTSSHDEASTVRSLASSGSNSPRASVPSTQLRQRRKTILDRVNVATVPAVAAVSAAASSAPEVGDSSPNNRGVSDDSRVPLRMEIQTKNPNIRLIWFAPGRTKQLSPNSKGT